MAPRTRHRLASPAQMAEGGELPVAAEEQPSRRSRGKAAGKAFESIAKGTPLAAEARADADLDGQVPGFGRVQRLDRRRVTAKRPRGVSAEGQVAANLAELAEARNALDHGAVPTTEAAISAKGTAVATRAREEQMWAQGYARVAGARCMNLNCRCDDMLCLKHRL